MKKYLVILFLTIIAVSVSIYQRNKNTNFITLKNLTLENIEALASNEDDKPDTKCYSIGAIDCHGYKVEYFGEYDKLNRFFDFN